MRNFHYLWRYEDAMRFGIAKPETRFPFASALFFRYLWKLILQSLNDYVSK